MLDAKIQLPSVGKLEGEKRLTRMGEMSFMVTPPLSPLPFLSPVDEVETSARLWPVVPAAAAAAAAASAALEASLRLLMRLLRVGSLS